jgi:hypothetical protein
MKILFPDLQFVEIRFNQSGFGCLRVFCDVSPCKAVGIIV